MNDFLNNYHELVYLGCVIFVLVQWFLFSFSIRGITFFSQGNDNMKQAFAASQVKKWKWFSDMHQYGNDKTRMKDGVILLLVVMQFFSRDKESDFPLVCLCGLANAISAILVLNLVDSIWGIAPAFFIFILFVTSFWPWQIALMGGHICVGQMFFLLSLVCLNSAINCSSLNCEFIMLFLSGVLATLTQFSSSSSRKFIPLYIAGYVYWYGLIMWPLIFIMMGAVGMLVLLLMPNFISNIKGYYNYFHVARDYTHFKLYFNYFREIGKPIKTNMRGEGWKWIFLFLRRVAPMALFLYFLSISFMLIESKQNLWMDVIIILCSLSPALWAELTRAPQIGRTYYPLWYGMVIVISISIANLSSSDVINSLVLLLLIVNAIWNLYVYLKDVYPSRMSVTLLVDYLHQHNISAFYTYRTRFNEAFVDTMNVKDKNQFKITYINSLNDISQDEGFVVVPGGSAKALNMESLPEGINNKDFRSDLELNKLIDSKKILECAVMKIKTFGNSTIWVQESEVPTYRDLVLKDIDSQDRWKSYAWVIDIKKFFDLKRTYQV